MKKNNSTHCRSPLPTSTMQGKSALSFKEAMRLAEDQIEIECFPRYDALYAKDICRVMAEVYMMPEAASIKIEGEMMPARVVKEIFSELDHCHVVYVIDELKEYTGKIFAMKPFIRTLLYNSVLTMESAISNEVKDI